MILEEMKMAFDEGMADLRRQMSDPPKSEESMLLMGTMLLREFLVDHKRIADALERLADAAPR